MDDGGRDIPPCEELPNYVYPQTSAGDQLIRYDLEDDTSILPQQPDAAQIGIQSRRGFRVQEPVDTTPDSTGMIYNRVFGNSYEPPASNYFCTEETRFTTFSDWPRQSVVKKEDLARNGFIYTGTGDKVRCVYCSTILRQWDRGDIVEREHQRNSPSCPFVLGQNVGNVPLSAAQHTPHHNIGATVPDALAARPANGYDIGPDEIHCGSGFIPPVCRMSSLNMNDSSARSNNSGSGSPRRIYSISPRNPQMSAEPDRLVTFSSWPAQMNQKPEDLAQAGLYYIGEGDKVKCFHCDGLLFNWDPTDIPFVEHAKWFPTCQYIRLVKGEKFVDDVKNGRVSQDEVMQTPAVLAVLHEGYSVEIVQMALTAMKEKNGAAVVLSAHNLMQTLMDMEDEVTERGFNDHMPPEDVEKLQRENETLRDKQQCKICMERDVEVIFYPCKHFVCCAVCSVNMDECPICRASIESIDKVFMA